MEIGLPRLKATLDIPAWISPDWQNRKGSRIMSGLIAWLGQRSVIPSWGIMSRVPSRLIHDRTVYRCESI